MNQRADFERSYPVIQKYFLQPLLVGCGQACCLGLSLFWRSLMMTFICAISSYLRYRTNSALLDASMAAASSALNSCSLQPSFSSVCTALLVAGSAFSFSMRMEMLMLWSVSCRRDDWAERLAIFYLISQLQSMKLLVSCSTISSYRPGYICCTGPPKEMRLFSQKKWKMFFRHFYKFLFQCYKRSNIWSLSDSSAWDLSEETNRTCLGGYYSREFLVTTCLKLKVVSGEVAIGRFWSALSEIYEAKEREVAILTKLQGSFMSVRFYLFSECLAAVEGIPFSFSNCYSPLMQLP